MKSPACTGGIALTSGWELSGMLTNELAATGSFSMVERSKLEHVLDEQNLAASDHGEEYYDHGRLKHGMQLYDESVRVPLLFSAPGLLNPGRRERPVETRGVADAALSLFCPESGRPRPIRASTPGVTAPSQGF